LQIHRQRVVVSLLGVNTRKHKVSLAGFQNTRETPAPAKGPRCNDDRSAVLMSGFPFPADEEHKPADHGLVMEGHRSAG
jgi:hypothetical protein